MGLPRSRAAAVLLAAATLVPATAGAAARPVDGPSRALELGADLLDAIAARGAAGTLGRVLASLGHPVPPGREPAAAGPLRRLRTAVREAEALRARAVARLTPAQEAALLDPLAPAAAAPPPATIGDVFVRPGLWRTDPAARAAARLVDQALMDRAALVILEAIDAAAPDLHRIRAAGTASHCGAQGTMIFESSDCRVLVGGDGPNSYGPTADPVLLVDVGGDDEYTNRTAAATAGVRVVVDVSGDDRYATDAVVGAGSATAQVIGQGAGVLGVGVLADLAGDDVYSLTAAGQTPEPGPAAAPILIVGQGAGLTGAGVLVDGTGADTYDASGTSTGGAVSVVAQGAGSTGLGALLDLDPTGGADSRIAYASSTLHKIVETPTYRQYASGNASVTAQGAAAAGAGVLVDVAGNDHDRASAWGSVATVAAQGGASLGAGAFVDGAGDDSIVAEAIGDATLVNETLDPSVCWDAYTTVATGPTTAIAQGGASGGFGALADGGGNDTRALVASSTARAITRIASDFDCSFAGGQQATSTATGSSGRAIGQGAVTAGLGVLLDAGGNDVDSLSAASEAWAEAIATSPGPDYESATATTGTATTNGQGQSVSGLGVIADMLGDDSYWSSGTSVARRITSAGEAVAEGPVVQLIQGWGDFGAGWLLDMGGADSYGSSPPASAAANDSCWSNGKDGRGRDLPAGPVPSSCP